MFFHAISASNVSLGSDCEFGGEGNGGLWGEGSRAKVEKSSLCFERMLL